MSEAITTSTYKLQERLSLWDRNYWCTEFRCSLKELMLAEGAVGSDPGRIAQYLEHKDIL